MWGKGQSYWKGKASESSRNERSTTDINPISAARREQMFLPGRGSVSTHQIKVSLTSSVTFYLHVAAVAAASLYHIHAQRGLHFKDTHRDKHTVIHGFLFFFSASHTGRVGAARGDDEIHLHVNETGGEVASERSLNWIQSEEKLDSSVSF